MPEPVKDETPEEKVKRLINEALDDRDAKLEAKRLADAEEAKRKAEEERKKHSFFGLLS